MEITVYKQFKKAYLNIGRFTYSLRLGNDGNVIDVLFEGNVYEGEEININIPPKFIRVINSSKKRTTPHEPLFVRDILNPADKSLIYFTMIFKIAEIK